MASLRSVSRSAVAGVALAAGVAPRLSAAVLARLPVPTTLAGHPFWNEADPGSGARRRTQFLENLCMLGGLPEFLATPGRKESPP